MKKYPDISSLLQKKMQRRRQLAQLSFEEKIAIVNKWRELAREIRSIRETQSVTPRKQVQPDQDEYRNTLP